MSGAKIVVYGRGRWREVDLASGRVAGWGAASFVCMRRGRLECVPRAVVQRALSAAGRQLGASKDGPRLSQIRDLAITRQSTGRTPRQWEGCTKAHQSHHAHECCQQHHLQSNTDTNFNSILKPPTITVGVQCSGQAAAAVQATLMHADRVNHSLKYQLQADPPHRNSDQGCGELRSKDHGSKGSGRRTLISSKKKTQEPTSSDAGAGADTQRKDNLQTKRALTSEAVETKVVQVRRNVSQEVFSSNSDFETRRSKNLHRSKALVRQAIENKVVQVRRNQSSESSSSDSEFESRRKKNLQRNKGGGSKGPRSKGRGSRAKSKSLSQRQYEETRDSPPLEMLISEEMVMLVRSFVEKDESNVFGVQLELYDTDDEYKRQFFYRLNPVVDVERCPQISRMLRDRASMADSVSLQDFIATLGLRSVTNTSAGQTRYRMRARRSSDVTELRPRGHSDSELDKENDTKAAPRVKRDNTQLDRVLEENTRNKHHNRQLKPGSNSRTKMRDSPRKQLKEVDVISNKGRKGLKDVGDVGSKKEMKELKEVRDLSSKKERKELKEVGGRDREEEEGGKKKPAKGRGGGIREYSAAEDEHVVRWVRGAGRASMVNGNRLWRQLQPDHHASTGCFRSWQSLRNRYLRYLLPALGAMPLPPQEAARLRAAAATGEMKTRKLPARRASVFHQPPVRSAWGRLPRPKPQETLIVSDAEEEASQTRSLRSANATHTLKRALDQSPKRNKDALARSIDQSAARTKNIFTRTPTYSELTKRFAVWHRSTPNSDSVRPTDSTDTSSALSSSTTSSDRRVRPRGSTSDSGARPPPKRRRTRQPDTNQTVDTDSNSPDADKPDRRRGQTARNLTTKRARSKSLDRDSGSEPSGRRTSARLTNGNSKQLAATSNKQSNKRRRSRTPDSDTDSRRPNKRLRSDRSENTDNTKKQSGVNSDSLRLNGKLAERRQRLNADQSLIKDYRPTGKADRRSDKNVRNDQNPDKSDRQAGSSQRIDKSDRHADKKDRLGDKSDRHADKRDRLGDKSDRHADKRDRLGDKSDRHADKRDRLGDKSGQRRDTSALNNKGELRRDERGRFKPRTRRLYNPNAM
ncbi:zinc finger CCCH domain-containing protein 13-like isoform X2 [Maniola jurtina]|uniref:zinc finger CCCH domain-containing protein 13-like isoform X2 n=1 Tax=Maniola jurtina TaxID=191418 RepID=UPI001E68BC5A|nr:zinc finger CCCH domain-containing protein 13-like isoform X2 [Maniola jurtina]